jgi:hypothetical protein
MGIKEEAQDINLLHTTITNLSKRHSDKMKSLVERIENGESSGDKVFDFCVACYGQLGFQEEVRAPYVLLSEKLKGRNGREILWTQSIETTTGEGDHTVETEITMDLRIGRLNSDNGLEFDLKNKSLVFSAEPYLQAQHTFQNINNINSLEGIEWKFTQGKLMVSHINLPHLAESVLKRDPYSHYGPDGKSQILVGNEVREFFENASSVGKSETYQNAIDLLTPEKETPKGG